MHPHTDTHTETQRTVTATAATPCFSHPAAPAGFDNSRLEHGNMQLPGVSNTTESTHTRTHTQTQTHTNTLHLHHIPSLLLVFFSLSPASFQPFLSLIFLHSYIFIPAWQSVPSSPISFAFLLLFLPVSFHSSSCLNYLIYTSHRWQKVIPNQ